MNRMIFWLLTILSLSGCALAPGMKMDLDRPDMPPGVKIKPITANLIQEQEANMLLESGEMQVNQEARDNPDYLYRIGVRDVLSITVWDHPELTIPAGAFRSAEAAGHLVTDDGTIFFPYVGTVSVSGKTIQEVRRILTDKLAFYIQNPQLDVRVAAFRSQKAHVVGEVPNPGPQPITDVPLTVVEAINRAGGLTENADMLNLNLTRDGGLTYINLLALYEDGDTSQNLLLQDGDILHVADRKLQKVFVLGEVKDPSSLIVHKGRMSLAEAISDAGGVDPRTSDPAQIYVVRGSPSEPEIYHLNGKSPDTMVLADRFALQPRDVVYVETAAVTDWNRVVSQLLPSFRSLDLLYPL